MLPATVGGFTKVPAVFEEKTQNPPPLRPPEAKTAEPVCDMTDKRSETEKI